MPQPELVAAIQPWVAAYNTWAQTPDQTSSAVTLPAITVPGDVARQILKALTGDQAA